MDTTWDEEYKNLWDNRYKKDQYAYGKLPNRFFREELDKIPAGQILMPADGEGRNGVYAAKSGWQVTSFDLSAEGRSKALQLAKEEGVLLQYLVGDLRDLDLPAGAFDAAGLIYAHFAAGRKSALHRKIDACLKPGGQIIFEAFSKKHLPYIAANPKVGGPRDIDMLFSSEEIRADFPNYHIILLEETEVDLEEGPHHIGTGSVIRFVGTKPLL